MRIIKVCLLAVFALSISGLSAQYAVEKKKAEHFFAKQGYSEAAETYKKAYGLAKTPEDKVSMIYMVAESYRLMEEVEQAETWYRRAIKSRTTENMAYYYLGKSLQSQNRCDEAIEEFNKYRDKGGDNGKADMAIASCDLADKLRDEATRYVVEPVPQLNTEFYDFGTAFANKDNSKLLIGSSREGSTGVEDYMKLDQSWMDLFESSQDKKGKWSEPVRLGTNVNTYGNEGAASLNADRDRLYFTRCPNDKKSQNQFGCDIYVAPRAGGKWGTAKKLELKPKDQPMASVGQPCISKDGSMLFFASDMKADGAKGGKDIYAVKYDAGSKSWGQPKNLTAINTTGDDMFPFLRNNGTLYFASNGHNGLGGLDNYMAEKTGDMEWGNVENLKYPINTNYNDFGMVFDGDEERGYLSSNRAGGKGYDDVYFFTLPAVEFKLEAYIFDKENGTPLSNSTVSIVGSDGSSYELQADENGLVALDKNGDESYIKPGVNYSIVASATDYLVAKDQVSTVGLEESTTFVKEFLLQSTLVEEIEFPEVQYDLGKFELRPESKDSLDYLYQTLVDNPTIIIELSAHTDSRGGNQSNETLSQNRAKSCVDYLISKGIPSERMSAKGYGERRLRISDAEINKMATIEEKEAAHQKNRRTVFSVLSWDYVPK